MEHMHAHRITSRRRRGYTLIELMITVAIVGILAATAIPSFISYLKKSKTSEAVAFLSAIKHRQASYFSEFGQYCVVSTAQTDWNPSGTPSETALTWATDSEWTQLGAAPDSVGVMFQYSSVADAPGNLPSSKGFSDDRGYSGSNFWFISSARADLNGDGTFVTFESYSDSTNLYISSGRGWE